MMMFCGDYINDDVSEPGNITRKTITDLPTFTIINKQVSGKNIKLFNPF